MKHPIPKTLNTLLCFGQIISALILITLASHTASWWVFSFAALSFSFTMQLNFSLVHEAEHNKLHPNKFWNEALGTLLASFFPCSYFLMKELHLQHHRRNRSDAELVDYYGPHESALGKSALYYFLLSGGVWLSGPMLSLVLSLTPRPLLKKILGENPKGTAGQYVQFLQGATTTRVRLESLLSITLLSLAYVAFGWKLSALAACYSAFAFSWSSQQYIYHIRTPRHLVEGAYNLKLWRPLEMLYLNFNYHLSHHRAVHVPWIHMKNLYEAPTLNYGSTYLKIWAPPQAIQHAWPQKYQKKGALEGSP